MMHYHAWAARPNPHSNEIECYTRVARAFTTRDEVKKWMKTENGMAATPFGGMVKGCMDCLAFRKTKEAAE